MIIKVAEKAPDSWSLWVQDKPGDDQPPTHTASGRTHEEIGALLVTIMQANTDRVTPTGAARLVAVPADAILPTPADPRAAQSQALYAMLVNLDGWIDGAKENHEALEHRGENIGSECWRSFEAADIRTMVNDVCRELGIQPFPIAAVNVEDRP